MFVVTLVLIICTYGILGIDVIKGPGSFAKHFLIDGKLLAVLAFLAVLYFGLSKSRLIRTVLIINKIVLLPITALYLFFTGLEAMHYPNYVLATYGIHLDAFVFVPLFSLLLLISEKIKEKPLKLNFKNIDSWILSIIVILVGFFGIQGLGTSLNTAIINNAYIIFHSNNSYDEKMFYQWGDFYNYMKFVKDNTPEKAKVIIPPELDPWLTRTGDIQLVRAFLYPRDLIQFNTVEIPDIKSLGQGTFIFVSWGDRDCQTPGCHGWPKQEIEASEIIYKDPSSSRVIETKNNTLYVKDNYKYVYGLIKI